MDTYTRSLLEKKLRIFCLYGKVCILQSDMENFQEILISQKINFICENNPVLPTLSPTCDFIKIS